MKMRFFQDGHTDYRHPSNQVAGDWFWTPLFDYLEKLGNSGGSSSGGGLTDNWFTRYEIHFVYELLMLASDSMATGSALRSTLHTAALVTLEAVPVGDEFIAGQLLRRIVFNQIFAGLVCTPLVQLVYTERTRDDSS